MKLFKDMDVRPLLLVPVLALLAWPLVGSTSTWLTLTVAVMDNGRVVHRGAMAELAEDEGLQQRLLGLSLGAHQ